MPASAVAVEDLDDDLCLYRPDLDEVLVLNQSAGDVFRLADGRLSVTELIESLARAYGASADDLAGDVYAVIEDLHARGYLQEGEPEPAPTP